MKNYIDFEPNGKNRTSEVVHALLHAQDGTTLRFREGVYDFYAEGAYKGYFFPTCNRSSDKKVAFPLLHLNDITVDGSGAQFIFHDRMFPIIAQGCTGVTLKGFSIDFSFPRCCEASVTEADGNGFMLAIDEDVYDYDANSDGNFIIRAGGKTFSTCEQRVFIHQPRGKWASVFFLLAGRTFAHYDSLPAPLLTCAAERRSGGIYFRYDADCRFRPDLVPGQVFINYDERRDNDVIFLDTDTRVRIENVRIYRGGGMGVVGQCCEDVTLDGLTIKPREGESFSTTADGILLANFSGRLTIENCRIERTIDDAINVHGCYTRVDRIVAPNKVAARLSYVSSSGLNIYYPGDRVVTIDSDGANETGAATVRDSYIEDDPYLIFLEFEEDITELLHPGDYLENPGRTPETIIRNCYFSDFPCLRLSSAQRTVFENNTVKNCNRVMLDDIMRFWYISGRVRDVEIRNNSFENLEGIAAFLDRPEGNVRHENIRVVDNLFRNCQYALDAERVDGLVFRGNRLENVGTAVSLRNCVNVDIE